MRKLAFVLLLLIPGCMEPGSDNQKRQVMVSEDKVNQFRMERIALVRDSLAYDGYRGIYIITDTKTHKTYFGVSGIGITETGSHLAGKVQVEDER